MGRGERRKHTCTLKILWRNTAGALSLRDRIFAAFAQPDFCFGNPLAVISWLRNSPWRLPLSEDNLSGLCKISFRGHCLGMQTASRPSTPTETCSPKSAVSKLDSLLGTLTADEFCTWGSSRNNHFSQKANPNTGMSHSSSQL